MTIVRFVVDTDKTVEPGLRQANYDTITTVKKKNEHINLATRYLCFERILSSNDNMENQRDHFDGMHRLWVPDKLSKKFKSSLFFSCNYNHDVRKSRP